MQNDVEQVKTTVGLFCGETKGRRGSVSAKNVVSNLLDHCTTLVLFLFRLHQLEILGHRLIAQFSNIESDKKFHPSEMKSLKPGAKDSEGDQETAETQKLEDQRQKLAQDTNSLNEKFGMEYPLDPRLQYVYPAPNVTILTNIANALASVPKFYVQVLHLMNKMNLPAPFGQVTMTPPLAASEGTEQVQPVESDVEERQMEISSEEESELESDEEDASKSKAEHPAVAKRVRNAKSDKPRKRPKLQFTKQQGTKSKSTAQKVEEVFEVPTPGGNKRTEFKLTPAIGLRTQETQVSVGTDKDAAPENITGPADQATQNPSTSWDVPSAPDLLSGTEEAARPAESGFGKIEPVAKQAEENEPEEQEEEWGATEFISSRKLRRNQLSHRETREYSAFRNYQEGEPTSRLYIKNVAKQVTEKDLHYVYGKYVDWEDEAQKLVFDIRLMKEGRMKGQAFITLPDEKRALEALKDTHAFMMKGKPIVVQFARSSKPKEKDGKDKKSKD